MSDLLNALIAEEINLRKLQPGKHKGTCPKCSHRRPGERDLVVTVNQTMTLAEWRCENCLWSGKVGEVELAPRQHIAPANQGTFVEPSAPKAEPATGDFKYLAQFGISDDIIKAARVTYEAEIDAFAFPYFENGKLVNVAHVTADGQVTYQARAKNIFYGLDSIKPVDMIDHTTGDSSQFLEIIIVSSEIIALALITLGMRNVLAAPQGLKPSKGGNDYLGHAADLLGEADKVTLVMRNDALGEEMKTEMARRIGAAKCNIAVLPDGMVDLAMVITKLGGDLALCVIGEAQPIPIKGLYEISQFEDSLLQYFDVGMASGVSTGWENVDRFFSVLLGEVTVITGIPNMGKSEWLDALVMNLAELHGWRIGAFSPEHSKEEHTTKLIEKRAMASTMPNRADRMNRETFIEVSSWVSHHFLLIVADDEDDMPTLEWVLERARAAILRYGIKVLILDPWNEVESSRPAHVSETDFVSIALSKIKKFARVNGIHVFIVAHPRTQYRDKKTNEYPVPSGYDISGSAHWVNKPHNVIVIHRHGDALDSTTIYFKKIKKKYVGTRGDTPLLYDLPTGRYSTPDSQQKESIYKRGKDSKLPSAIEGDTDVVVIEPEA